MPRDGAGSDCVLGSCRVCDEPSSEDPHEWPEDITKWPVRKSGGTLGEFMLAVRGRRLHPTFCVCVWVLGIALRTLYFQASAALLSYIPGPTPLIGDARDSPCGPIHF